MVEHGSTTLCSKPTFLTDSVAEVKGKSFSRLCFVCQPLCIYCPLGMQMRGMVNLKLHVLIQSKVSLISPSIQIISGSNSQVCFVSIEPTDWENSMYSTSLSCISSKGLKFWKECGFLYCYSSWFGQVWTVNCFWQISTYPLLPIFRTESWSWIHCYFAIYSQHFQFPNSFSFRLSTYLFIYIPLLSPIKIWCSNNHVFQEFLDNGK